MTFYRYTHLKLDISFVQCLILKISKVPCMNYDLFSLPKNNSLQVFTHFCCPLIGENERRKIKHQKSQSYIFIYKCFFHLKVRITLLFKRLFWWKRSIYQVLTDSALQYGAGNNSFYFVSSPPARDRTKKCILFFFFHENFHKNLFLLFRCNKYKIVASREN